MGVIGVYFESWACPWVAKAEDLDLSKIDDRVKLVNIAFVQPNCSYVRGSNKWDGTGLNFSMDFKVVKDSIDILKKRGVCVMLAVGGGAYWSSPQPFNAQSCVDLMNDLGCSGIDIDWEVGLKDSASLVNAIPNLKAVIGNGFISFCGFSTGANPMSSFDTTYSGMNLDAIKLHGDKVNWINVMEYDAGKGFDKNGSYLNYRKVYKGMINFGFEIGIQGWGDDILLKDEVLKSCTNVKNNNNNDGVFLWAYYSKAGPGASVKDVIDISYGVFGSQKYSTPVSMKPTYSCPSSVNIMCPACKHLIKTSWSDGA